MEVEMDLGARVELFFLYMTENVVENEPAYTARY